MRLTSFTLLVFFVFGCGADVPHEPPSVLTVAASIPPHAWLIKEIGGEGVRCHAVLGPGDSPATYQPSDAQVSALLESRIFFRAGVPYEEGSWFTATSRKLQVVDLSHDVPLRSMDEEVGTTIGPPSDHHHADGAHDPHIWLSPRRLIIQARHIARTLSSLDPLHTDTYAERLEAVIERLVDVDTTISSLFEAHAGRTFVVFHPSWGYFADDYGLRQIAIEIAGKDPSDGELTRIQERTRDLGVSVVFVQPQIAGRSAHAVAATIGARVENLDPLRADVLENLRESADKIARSFDD